MSRKQITLVDIANACGTSNVTVSKALAGKGGMSDELREKIIATAEEMGYTSNKSSASVNGMIGVIIPQKFINPNGSFYWALYNNIVHCLKQKKLSCIQENLMTEEEEELIMPAFFKTATVSGVISLGQLSEEYLEKLSAQGIPLLLLDYYSEGIDADNVVTNGFFGGYKITSYLISQGHEKIGFVGTCLATTSIFDRYMGYVKAMLEHGLPTEDKWLVEDRTKENDLFEKITFPEEMPTAFVCNCDETAFKVIRDLKILGYSVPDDISVVGYDNYLISEISEPPITTVNVDAKEMAELAVTTIIERIKNPKAPTGTYILNGKIVHKGSVKKIK